MFGDILVFAYLSESFVLWCSPNPVILLNIMDILWKRFFTIRIRGSDVLWALSLYLSILFWSRFRVITLRSK